MKFTDYYLSQPSRTLSLIVGLLAGLIVGLFGSWQYGVLAGCSVAIVASVFIPLRVYLTDLPCLKMQEKLPRPFLINQRVRFAIRDGSVTGFFVLTAEQIVLMSSDRGKQCVTLSRGDVKSVRPGENRETELQIFVNETQYIRVVCAFAGEMLTVLAENGWS